MLSVARASRAAARLSLVSHTGIMSVVREYRTFSGGGDLLGGEVEECLHDLLKGKVNISASPVSDIVISNMVRDCLTFSRGDLEEGTEEEEECSDKTRMGVNVANIVTLRGKLVSPLSLSYRAMIRMAGKGNIDDQVVCSASPVSLITMICVSYTSIMSVVREYYTFSGGGGDLLGGKVEECLDDLLKGKLNISASPVSDIMISNMVRDCLTFSGVSVSDIMISNMVRDCLTFSGGEEGTVEAGARMGVVASGDVEDGGDLEGTIEAGGVNVASGDVEEGGHVDEDTYDDYRIDTDCSFRSDGSPAMGVANIVTYNKERFVMSLLSRAVFVRDSTHGELVSVLMGIGVALKLGMDLFQLYNDNKPLIDALTGKGTIHMRYLDLIQRVQALMTYTECRSQDVLCHMTREFTKPPDQLGKYYKAAGLKSSHGIRLWRQLLDSVGVAKKRYSTSIPNSPNSATFAGYFSGLKWVPESSLVKAGKSDDDDEPFYGQPFVLQSPEDERYFRGLDFEHWLIILHPSFGSKEERPEQLLDKYVKLVQIFFPSEPDPSSRIYSATFERFYAFGCVMSQPMAECFECDPSVLVAIPDFYLVPETRDFGGHKVVDGRLVSRSTEDQAMVDAAFNSPSYRLSATMRRKTDAQIVEELAAEEKRKAQRKTQNHQKK